MGTILKSASTKTKASQLWPRMQRSNLVCILGHNWLTFALVEALFRFVRPPYMYDG